MDFRRGRSDAQSGAARAVVLTVAPHAIDNDVLEAARSGEPERYLAATLAPEPHRAALIALAAFSADLRRIPVIVKEPMMGEIRLQWWRETIERFDRGGDGATGHPIADALREAVRAHNLPIAPLIAMTEARAFDLYLDPMPDRAAFDGYLDKTEGVPFLLALGVAGTDAKIAAPLADLGSRTYGLARLLAELPHWLSRGRNPLPLDLLAKHNVDRDSLLRGRVSPGVHAAIGDLLADLQRAYAQARSRWRELPQAQRPAMLPIATITSYLAGLQAQSRDPLREPFELQPLKRIWRIGRAHWLGP